MTSGNVEEAGLVNIILTDVAQGSQSALRGLLHKIVRFETYLAGRYVSLGVGTFPFFPFCETYLPPQNVPTGRYASKQTILCNRPQVYLYCMYTFNDA